MHMTMKTTAFLKPHTNTHTSSKNLTMAFSNARTSKQNFNRAYRNDSSVDSVGDNCSELELRSSNKSYQDFKNMKLKMKNAKKDKSKKTSTLLNPLYDNDSPNEKKESMWNQFFLKISKFNKQNEITLDEVNLRIKSVLSDGACFNQVAYNKKERLKVESTHYIPHIVNLLKKYDDELCEEKYCLTSPNFDNRKKLKTTHSTKIKRNVGFNLDEKEKRKKDKEKIVEDNYYKSGSMPDQNTDPFNPLLNVIVKLNDQNHANKESISDSAKTATISHEDKPNNKSIIKSSNIYNLVVKNAADVLVSLANVNGDYSNNLPSYLNSTQIRQLGDMDFVRTLQSNNVPLNDVDNLKHEIKAYEKELNLKKNLLRQITNNEFTHFYNFNSVREGIKKARTYRTNVKLSEIDMHSGLSDKLITKIKHLNI